MITKLLRTFRSPCFHFIRGRLFSCLSISSLNLCAALLEGISFSFILVAFSALSGSSTGLSFLSFFSFSSLAGPKLFSLGILLAITSQILRSVLSFIGHLLATRLSAGWQFDIQKKIMSQIMGMSFAKVSTYKTGDLVDYIKTPATSFHQIVSHVNLSLISFLTAAILLITMAFLSPYLTLLAAFIFGLFGYCQKGLVKKIAKTSHTLSEILVKLSEDSVEILHNLRAIFTFDRQKKICAQTETNLKHTADLSQKMHFWHGLILPLNEISGVLLVGLFLILGQWASTGEEKSTLPLLLTFITIIYRLNSRLQIAFSQLGYIAFHWGQVQRMEQILVEAPVPEEASLQPIQELKEHIHFNCVFLQHPSRSAASLQALNLTFPKGKISALVGPSGAGKSSILDLLLRLYEPTKGQILIDGKPTSLYSLGNWRRQFGVVSQEISVLHGTIADNIRFGREEVSDEEVMRAAIQAGADLFIEHLPLKYDTLVGEKGHSLSGGERQRLILARALLSNPSILILDEATSHLDSHSEMLIQQTLCKLRQEKTIILVAHRLATVAIADEITVLDKGQIIEQGTHESLLKKEGAYARLFSLAQTSPNMSL